MDFRGSELPVQKDVIVAVPRDLDEEVAGEDEANDLNDGKANGGSTGSDEGVLQGGQHLGVAGKGEGWVCCGAGRWVALIAGRNGTVGQVVVAAAGKDIFEVLNGGAVATVHAGPLIVNDLGKLVLVGVGSNSKAELDEDKDENDGKVLHSDFMGVYYFFF